MVTIPPILQGIAQGACWEVEGSQAAASFTQEYQRKAHEFSTSGVLKAQTVYFIAEVLAWLAKQLDRANIEEPFASIMLQVSRVSCHLRATPTEFDFGPLMEAQHIIELALERLLPNNSALIQRDLLANPDQLQLPLQSRRAYAGGTAVVSLINALLARNEATSIEYARAYVVSVFQSAGDITTARQRFQDRLLAFLSVGSRATK